jgi:hypothetical protein
MVLGRGAVVTRPGLVERRYDRGVATMRPGGYDPISSRMASWKLRHRICEVLAKGSCRGSRILLRR